MDTLTRDSEENLFERVEAVSDASLGELKTRIFKYAV